MARRVPLDILLVEDQRINQKVAINVLKRLGYQADVAVNGLRGLEAIRRRAYDVVLMDLLMPEMDGIEATQAIRAELPGERQPYIIAISATVKAQDRVRCVTVGMNDFITKPFQVGELVAALERVDNASRFRVAMALTEQAVSVELDAVERLRRLLGDGDDSELLRFLEEAIADMAEMIERCQEGMALDRIYVVVQQSQQLIAAARTVGAVVLAGLAGALEQSANEQQFERVRSLLVQIADEFAQVKVALARSIHRNPTVNNPGEREQPSNP